MTASSDAKLQNLTDHLIELRKRILYCIGAMVVATAIAYVFKDPIYGFLVQPLSDAMGEGSTNRLIYTSLTEGFFTYLRVAFFAGAFVTFPFILWQVWMFIYLVATPILFVLGGALVYYLIIPMAWNFFLSFQSGADDTVLPVQLEARISEYLSLIMTLIFAFGLSFQLPVVMSLLAHAGVLTAQNLIDFRRYAIVIFFIIAAIITPPDVISQIGLAIPLCLLYELSIFLVRRIEKARQNA
jgi:sec-independent protein translocase protein TatC